MFCFVVVVLCLFVFVALLGIAGYSVQLSATPSTQITQALPMQVSGSDKQLTPNVVISEYSFLDLLNGAEPEVNGSHYVLSYKYCNSC